MSYESRLDEKLNKEMNYYPCDVCTDQQQWQYGGAGRCHVGCPHFAIEYDAGLVADNVAFDSPSAVIGTDIPF